MGNTFNFFMTIIIVQAFYAFSITVITYSMPADTLDFVESFDDITTTYNMESISKDIEGGLTRQTNIPLIEIGALVFYSGNMIIDMMLNFITATPQMIALLMNGIMMLFSVDTAIFSLVQIFATVIITVLYILNIIQFISSMRSGQSLV